MKRLLLICSAVAVASGVAAAPAVAGLSGNSSFSHQIPVRVPTQASIPQVADDNGADGVRLVVPGASSGRHADDGRQAAASATPSRSATEPGDDRGGASRTAEPGDDRGATVEPGDDRGGATRTAEPGAEKLPRPLTAGTEGQNRVCRQRHRRNRHWRDVKVQGRGVCQENACSEPGDA